MHSFRSHLTKIVSTGTLALALISCGGGGGSSASTDSLASATPPISSASSNYAPKTISLEWSMPLNRANGDALSISEIGGYEVVYTTPTTSAVTISVDDALTTKLTIANLDPDTYSFYIYSYDSENRLSSASEPVVLPKSSFATI